MKRSDGKVVCDFCAGNALPLSEETRRQNAEHAELAIVDGPTRFGPYAFMCGRHLRSAGYPTSTLNTRLRKDGD